MRDITIQDIWATIIGHLPFLLIVPILVTMAVGGYLFLYAENEYTASVKLYVLLDYMDAGGNMRYDTSTSTQLANDYQQLIQTNEVLSTAAEKLNIDSLDDVTVRVAAIPNTRVIDLRVTDHDPLFASNAAGAIGDAFVEYMRSMTRTNNITIASRAETPHEPSGPRRLRNTALAFAISLVVCIGGLLAVETLNTKIRTPEEVESSLNVPILARIDDFRKELQQYRKGRGAVHKDLMDIVSKDTQENARMLALNLRFLQLGGRMKSMAVTSTAVGEGKSSVTVMLANAMSSEGQRVLVIDMDFRNPTIARYMGRRGQYDLTDYIRGIVRRKHIIVQGTGEHPIDYIDSLHPSALATNVMQTREFEKLMKWARKHYDVILVDTPPLGIFVDAAALASIMDGVLLVVATGRVDRAAAAQTVEQLRIAKANIFGVAMTFIKRKKSASRYYYESTRPPQGREEAL